VTVPSPYVTHSDPPSVPDRARSFEGGGHQSGLSVLLVDAPPGEGPRLHRHPYEEVFVVHAGRGTFTIDGAQAEAGPGDVVVAPAETVHKFVNSGSERLRLTAIHHAPRFVTEWLEEESD
jgi:mannose-6-phosphate isomerase-like protein (cupin superfamily)